MTNELTFFLFIAFYLLSALASYKMGRRFLELFIIVSSISLYCISGKMFDFFGLTASAGAAGYAGIFLATDMLTEQYGKSAGYKMVRIGVISIIMFMIITQVSLLFSPMEFSQELSNSMGVVFGTSLRLFTGSIIAYIAAQHFDVWFYHFIHSKTGNKFLWIRNNLSTATSQLIDSAIFVTVGFYGVVPSLWNVFIGAYIIKLGIALIDTPFIYMSRKLKPLDINE